MDEERLALECDLERPAATALFSDLAEALETDEPITLEDETVSLEVPPSLSLEFAVGEKDGTARLEAALEWPDADGESVRSVSAVDDEDDSPDQTGSEDPAPTESGDTDEAVGVEDPAASAMPLDSATGGAPSSAGKRTSRFEVYRDRAGEWRWRLVHWNGNIIADSGEGYASRYNAVRAVRGVMRAVPDARIEHLE